MYRSLLRSAIPGKSAERDHRGRICRKRRLLHSAGHCSFRLHSEKQLAEAIRTLQITDRRFALPLLYTSCYSGIGKPLERRCHQLRASGNGLPHRVHALRRVFGGSDLPGPSVDVHCKEKRKIGDHHLQRDLWRRAHYQSVSICSTAAAWIW